MQITCPCCFARYSLDAVVQDDASRELNALLAKIDRHVTAPLVAYLSLFRSKSRALGWERALRLAQEVIALTADGAALAAALSETVSAMREKQAQPSWKPLSNHNYLRRVLETVAGRGVALPVEAEPSAGPRTRTGQALKKLEDMKR